jgi:hypothetical protein
MPILLFNLSGVPDDEAAAVRELLTDDAIDYYETSAGRWGISQPALWLRDATQLTQAKALIDDYQAQRFQQAQANPVNESLTARLWHSPLRTLAFLAALTVILYFSIHPFLGFL